MLMERGVRSGALAWGRCDIKRVFSFSLTDLFN